MAAFQEFGDAVDKRHRALGHRASGEVLVVERNCWKLQSANGGGVNSNGPPGPIAAVFGQCPLTDLRCNCATVFKCFPLAIQAVLLGADGAVKR
jgi:hypothetical protein